MLAWFEVSQYLLDNTGTKPSFCSWFQWYVAYQTFICLLLSIIAVNLLTFCSGLLNLILTVICSFFNYYFCDFPENIGLFLSFFLKHWEFQVITNAGFSVNTFFFISGCLVAYKYINELENSDGKLNILFVYLQRYLR